MFGNIVTIVVSLPHALGVSLLSQEAGHQAVTRAASDEVGPFTRGLLTDPSSSLRSTLWILALGLVMFAAWWRLRRTSSSTNLRTGRLTVVDACPLGPRRTLYLVEFDGRTMLVASSEHGLVLEASTSTAPMNPGDGGGRP